MNQNNSVKSEVREPQNLKEAMAIIARLQSERDQLIQRVAEEQIASERRRNAAALLAHEAKTALAKINLSLNLLNKETILSPTERLELVGSGIRSCKNAQKALSLAISLGEPLRSYDLQSIVNLALRRDLDLLSDSGIIFTDSTCPTMQVITQFGIAETCISTIVENARQALVEKCETNSNFQPEIEFSCFIEDGYTVLQIADNGPGMSDEAKQKTFDSRYTTKPNGSGMGIYLARALLERLELSDTPGGGLTVKIYFPNAQ